MAPYEFTWVCLGIQNIPTGPSFKHAAQYKHSEDQWRLGIGTGYWGLLGMCNMARPIYTCGASLFCST